jgi:flagellin
MRIQNNVPALNAHRYYGINQANTQKSIAKLSSGYRINSAADDAAGLAISEKMRAQIRGLTMASKNTQDGISLIQTAEGGMQEVDNMLQRIRELVNYASNDTQEHNTMGTGDRQKIQDEIDQLVAEIDSMSERVEFNKKKLISGEFAGTGAASSKSIARLQTKLANAVQAENEALSQLNNAGKAYKTFTEQKDTSPLGKALLDFFGTTNASDVLATSGLWQNATSTNLGTVTQASYYTNSATIAKTNSALGRYADLIKEIASMASAFKGTAVASAYDEEYIATNEDMATFYSFLRGLSLEDTTALTGLTQSANVAAGMDVWGGVASSPVVKDLQELKVFASGGASDIFVDDQALSKLEKIGQYLTTHPLVLAESADGKIKTIVDAANKVVSAVNEFKNYTAEGGAYETAKTTYETAAKAEQSLYQGVKDKQNALDIARQEKNQAQRSLDEAFAKGTPNPGVSEGLYFQVGANAGQSLQLTIGSVKSDILGIGDGKGSTDIDVLEATGSKITGQLDTLDEALSYVTSERSKLGAAQNRLEYTMNSLEISAENLQSAESRVRDVDMAKEMTNFTKQNILFQASIAMLAQANAFPQGVLQLLG